MKLSNRDELTGNTFMEIDTSKVTRLTDILDVESPAHSSSVDFWKFEVGPEDSVENVLNKYGSRLLSNKYVSLKKFTNAESAELVHNLPMLTYNIYGSPTMEYAIYFLNDITFPKDLTRDILEGGIRFFNNEGIDALKDLIIWIKNNENNISPGSGKKTLWSGDDL